MYFNSCITGQQKVALNDRRTALCEVYPTSQKTQCTCNWLDSGHIHDFVRGVCNWSMN